MSHTHLTARAALVACLAFATLAGGCGRAQQVVKTTPPQATVQILVDSGTFVKGSNEEDIESVLRKDILSHKIGLPVAANAQKTPDLQIKVELSGFGNFSEARWVVLDPDSGVVLIDNKASYPFSSTDSLADDILKDLLTLDTDAYAGASGAKLAKADRDLPGDPPSASDDNPASSNDGSKAWAVVVGIEAYREKLPAARHAERDARAFEAFAQATLGIPPEQIKLLVGQRAGRGDLASALEEWLVRNASAQPDGPVYVYFSGHGAPDPATGDAYLVPYDADPAYLKTRGYPLKRLYATLGKLPNRDVYVFLDACFSGSGDRSVIADGTRPLVPVKVDKPRKAVVTFAAAEAAQTTGAAPNAQHGLFTFHLLEGLRGKADADDDANVTLGELKAYVMPKVARDARMDNREQTPTLDTPDAVKPERVTLIRGLQ